MPSLRLGQLPPGRLSQGYTKCPAGSNLGLCMIALSLAGLLPQEGESAISQEHA
jgi:hypothetical protein